MNHSQTPRLTEPLPQPDENVTLWETPEQLPMCWNCGVRPLRSRTSKLCPTCYGAGADPIWIPCTQHGWDHVARRTRRGQSSYTCRRGYINATDSGDEFTNY